MYLCKIHIVYVCEIFIEDKPSTCMYITETHLIFVWLSRGTKFLKSEVDRDYQILDSDLTFRFTESPGTWHFYFKSFLKSEI
jgi:hypothetical protein